MTAFQATAISLTAIADAGQSWRSFQMTRSRNPFATTTPSLFDIDNLQPGRRTLLQEPSIDGRAAVPDTTLAAQSNMTATDYAKRMACILMILLTFA